MFVCNYFLTRWHQPTMQLHIAHRRSKWLEQVKLKNAQNKKVVHQKYVQVKVAQDAVLQSHLARKTVANSIC